MIVDIVTFNGEKDLWDIRYNILKDYVDEFIVVEFDKTFSGKDKPFYGENFITSYVAEKPFVRYVEVKDNVWHKYKEIAQQSPNTAGAAHWKEEFMQKEYLKDCLEHLEDDDIVFVGDVDEIWRPYDFRGMKLKTPIKMELLVYSYYLNNRSSEQFKGTLASPYKLIKKRTLNHFRTQPMYWTTIRDGGWHFTSMGGTQEVHRKLGDSYTEETYYNPWVKEHLDENITQNKDFLGRDFTYTKDESEWPQYLKDNKAKYQHLCR